MRHGMIVAVFEDLALAVPATTSAATRTDKKQWAGSVSQPERPTGCPAAAP